MQPVAVFSMPHNYRGPLYSPGEAPSTFCDDSDYAAPPSDFADLPMPMPQCLLITTDDRGRPIAAWADGRQIRWKNLDIVIEGVRQYNVYCAQMGIGTPRPSPPDESSNVAD
jgi:hypothetical protein